MNLLHLLTELTRKSESQDFEIKKLQTRHYAYEKSLKTSERELNILKERALIMEQKLKREGKELDNPQTIGEALKLPANEVSLPPLAVSFIKREPTTDNNIAQNL